MLEMRIDKFGYVEIDTQEWIDDRTDGIHEAAQRAFDHYTTNVEGYDSALLLSFLERKGATGIYTEGSPIQVCTVNEESFLSSDVILTFANTKQYGPLLCIQDGYFTNSPVRIYRFNGDDDSNAFDYAYGYASCDLATGYRNGSCDAELIIESAVHLWQNGGNGSYGISDLTQESEVTNDGYAICPRCHMGNLTFYAN